VIIVQQLAGYGPLGVAMLTGLLIVQRPLRLLAMACIGKILFKVYTVPAAEQRRWLLEELERSPGRDLLSQALSRPQRRVQRSAERGVTRLPKPREPLSQPQDPPA